MSMIALDTPLAEALSTAVHTKIVEEGWTQDDDTSLAEYIVLMLANGKTQDQIASELAGELLQDAKGTTEFSQWLFEQVTALSNGPSGTGQQSIDQYDESQMQEEAVDNTTGTESAIPAAYDTDMGDNAPDNAPRGPKGLHGGRSSGRGGRGGISKPGDSALHRTRGNDRINSHVRGAPKGPRGGQNIRPGLQKALNGMGMTGSAQGMQSPMMQNGGQPNQQMMTMTPQQQMEFMSMMEQQARIMAQFMPGIAQAGMNGFQQNNGQPQQGRSLFDRVESGRGRAGIRGRGRGGIQNGAVRGGSKVSDADSAMEGESQAGEAASTETEQTTQPPRSNDPSTTMCHFNLRCTNKDCPYVHQSPAAPQGVVVDMSDTCSFGAACKNFKCVAKHPSPAQIRAHQAEELCKFFPNCQNPVCPYKHPNMPLCSFGAGCKNKDCKYTHLPTPCRFNPCLNARCPFKHEPGQNKTFADYTWTPSKDETTTKEHVSDRKFIAEDAGEEELIRPEQTNTNAEDGTGQTTAQQEVAT